MKRCFSLILVVVFLICSCTDTNSDDSNNSESIQSKSLESTDLISENNNDELYESDDNTSSNKELEVKPIKHESSDTKQIIDIGGTVVSDTPYYSNFGDSIYILSSDEDGKSGTRKITNGANDTFYPNAYNLYESDGAVYGMVIHDGDCACGVERSYCKLFANGTHEKLIDCWQVFYIGSKVYYYDMHQENADEEANVCLCVADLDGKNKTVIAENVPYDFYFGRIIEYNEYLIYSDSVGEIYSRTPQGDIINLCDSDEAVIAVQFVNNGFVYYAQFEYSSNTNFIDSSVEYSFWRVDLYGENRECIIENIEYNSLNIGAVCFGDRIIMFMPDNILVYNNDLSQYGEYSYESLGSFDFIEQICVLENTLSISGTHKNSNVLDTVIYDITGNVIFDTRS